MSQIKDDEIVFSPIYESLSDVNPLREQDESVVGEVSDILKQVTATLENMGFEGDVGEEGESGYFVNETDEDLTDSLSEGISEAEALLNSLGFTAQSMNSEEGSMAAGYKAVGKDQTLYVECYVYSSDVGYEGTVTAGVYSVVAEDVDFSYFEEATPDYLVMIDGTVGEPTSEEDYSEEDAVEEGFKPKASKKAVKEEPMDSEDDYSEDEEEDGEDDMGDTCPDCGNDWEDCTCEEE